MRDFLFYTLTNVHAGSDDQYDEVDIEVGGRIVRLLVDNHDSVSSEIDIVRFEVGERRLNEGDDFPLRSFKNSNFGYDFDLDDILLEVAPNEKVRITTNKSGAGAETVKMLLIVAPA